jgi:hypothetical protein
MVISFPTTNQESKMENYSSREENVLHGDDEPKEIYWRGY